MSVPTAPLAARQLTARALGGGRWRVEFMMPDGARSPDHEGSVVIEPARADAPAVRVETVAAPAIPGGPWSVVVTVEQSGALAREASYDLGVGGAEGWAGRIELSSGLGEPVAGPGDGAPLNDIDYRARDFEALRVMLEQRISRQVGVPLVAHPVSQTAALVELIAYLGDALSYELDAVATEAYLETARLRASVARHAELLDYRVFEGMSARAWIRVACTGPDVRVPAGTRFLTRVEGLSTCLDADAEREALDAGAMVFETLEDRTLLAGERVLPLSTAHHAAGTLAPGATRAVLDGHDDGLEPGSLVLIEPSSSSAMVGQVVRLQTVRRLSSTNERHHTRSEVEWSEADALSDETLLSDGPLRIRICNLVLVEHGATQADAALEWPAVGRATRLLGHPRTTCSAGTEGLSNAGSAAAMLVPAPSAAWPAVEIWERIGDHRRRWHQRRSLLASGPQSRDYVVELDNSGAASVRFGDGVNGMPPLPGGQLFACQRVGVGIVGNVGAEAIAHVALATAPITLVTNPSAAAGGAEPEALTSVKLNAPEAFRYSDRVVEEADYVRQMLRVPGVTDAAAALTFNGRRPVALAYYFAGGWSPDTARLAEAVRIRLCRHQPAGVDLTVRSARAVPVSAALEVTTEPGWEVASIVSMLDEALREAFLAPGRFGFGTPLYAGELVTASVAVPGVLDASVSRLGPAALRADAPALPVVVPPFGRILRLDNDPTRPELGLLTYTLRAAT
jgi:Baseplate J-like protein